MIRSTKTTLKFANSGKLNTISSFIEEYRKLTSFYIDEIWDFDKIPTFISKEITSKANTWLSARMQQCAGKQASAIVRGTKKKQSQRKWMIEKLLKEGKPRKAKKLKSIFDRNKASKPEFSSIEPELDSRFVKIDFKKGHFDGWITISSIGNKVKFSVPFKKTKHFNKLMDKGSFRSGIRLSNDKITFCVEIPDIPKTITGTTIGIDIGQKTIISCSNGFSVNQDKHGHTMTSITEKMSKKKKGSKAFKRCQEHRKNFINWSINQLNLKGVKQVNLENIKNLRKSKMTSRRLGHWTYTEIFGKLQSYCEEQGVLVHKISPVYTSQRCSKCGWTRKSNRNGKIFKCEKCGFTHDADLNASKNIALPLAIITDKQRLLKANRDGFYWLSEGQESIVPAVNETSNNDL